MRRSAVALFAGLVAATFAAFFVAQVLKSAPATVKTGKVVRYFSPNGDGRRDATQVTFTLKEGDEVAVNVLDADDNLVRRLETGLEAAALKPVTVTWDGRDDNGRVAPDGRYSLSLDLERQGLSLPVRGSSVFLDTTPPRPSVAETDPTIVGPVASPVRFRIRGVSSRKPTRVEILRTDVEPYETAARFRVPAGRTRGEWNGRTGGVPAPPGTYMVVVKVRDRAGNQGSGPAELPPDPRNVRGQPGITVRRLAVRAPAEPVRAGALIRFAVDSRGRPYRWTLRRVGQGRLAKRGRSSNFALGMHAPREGSGMYLLEVQAGRDRVTVPLLVQGNSRSPILVVVPAITWMGQAEVDDGPGFDGIPNTLLNGGPVAWPRVLSKLPQGVAEQVAPLLVALDRSGITYDLTTDLALTRSRDPRVTDRPAVLLAGSHRWVQRDLARRLRRYVSDGGRLASFGVESLRAGVSVGADTLRRPTPIGPLDPFGHRFADLRRPPSSETSVLQLDVLDGPDSPLLEAFDGTLSGFSVFEEASLGDGDADLELQASIGQNTTDAEIAAAEAEGELPREPLPVISLAKLGKGTVIRVGLPEWGSRIGQDPEVSQITRNIFDILRGVEPKPRSPL